MSFSHSHMRENMSKLRILSRVKASFISPQMCQGQRGQPCNHQHSLNQQNVLSWERLTTMIGGQAGRFSKTFEVSCTLAFSTVEYCIVSTYLLVYWLVKPQLGNDTHYTTAIEQNRTCPRPTPVFKGYDDNE